MIFLFFLFICGCNYSEEYDYRGAVPESRLVVYAYVEADSLLCADISKSRIYTDNTVIDTTKDVRCQIYLNDLYSGEMRRAGGNRYLSDVRPRAGDRVTLKASYLELKEVMASTTVCQPFPEIELDTFRDGQMLTLKVRVRDDGTPENYYRLVVENKTFNYKCLGGKDRVETDSSVKYTYDVDLSGDKLLTEETISTILGKEIHTNPYQVFTNETFRGQERVIHASVACPHPYNSEGWYVEERDTIYYKHTSYHQLRVKVLRIDQSLYKYLYTLGHNEKQTSLYKEPIEVYSNVEGGFGVVGSCYTREVVLDFPLRSQK